MNHAQVAELVRLLRLIADAIEEDPTFIDSFQRTSREVSDRRQASRFDPFRILSEEGEDALRSKLSKMTSDQLKRLIQENRLDTSGLSNKWTGKSKLMDFAFQRLVSRSKHGSVFLPGETKDPWRTRTDVSD